MKTRKADKTESVIPLNKDEKEKAASKLREYIRENFELDIGGLQASIFLDYITDNIGIYYYNQAIADSQVYLTEKTDDMFLLMKDET